MIRINLLPEELREKKRPPFFDRFLIYIVVFLIGEIVLFYFINNSQKKTIASLNSKIQETQKELQKLERSRKLVKGLKSLKSDIQKRLTVFEKMERKRPKWINMMQEVAVSLPKYTWLNNISTSGGEITLEGNTYSIRQNAVLLVNLVQSELFENIKLSQISQTSGGEKTIYSFTVKMNLHYGKKSKAIQYSIPNEEASKKKKGKGVVAEGRDKIGMDKAKGKEVAQSLQ